MNLTGGFSHRSQGKKASEDLALGIQRSITLSPRKAATKDLTDIRRRTELLKPMNSHISESGSSQLMAKKLKFTLSEMKKSELIDAPEKKKKEIVLVGKSLLVLSPTNKFRKFFSDIVAYKHFDNSILSCILLSTILLTLENPLDDPNG